MNYENAYNEAKFLAGLRRYGEAEEAFHSTFNSLELHVKDCRSLEKGNEIRHLVRSWAKENGSDSSKVEAAVKLLRRYLFLQMLIAQIYELGEEETKKQTRWGYCMITYVLATELMRSLDDIEVLQIENAYIRTHYGVLLGKAGRWYEAHRRLDEAAAYLSRSMTRCNSPVSWAIIDLHRAEVFLLSAQNELKKNSTILQDPEVRRKSLAFLNSTHQLLERAKERLTIEQRKNVWWWTWLYELQLTACVCVAKLGCHREKAILKKEGTNHCRFGCEEGMECVGSLRRGQQLSELDPFRQSRLVSLFMQFMKYRKKCNNHYDKTIETHCNTLQAAKESLQIAVDRRNDDNSNKKQDERVSDYVNSVLESAKKQLNTQL